jgi:16S rRNA C967 or C1407 C5-methylase (RsmB/RsmF family)
MFHYSTLGNFLCHLASALEGKVNIVTFQEDQSRAQRLRQRAEDFGVQSKYSLTAILHFTSRFDCIRAGFS